MDAVRQPVGADEVRAGRGPRPSQLNRKRGCITSIISGRRGSKTIAGERRPMGALVPEDAGGCIAQGWLFRAFGM